MLQRHHVKCSIVFLAVLLISACSTSKEVTKSKEFLDAGMFDQAIILLKQEVQSSPKNAEAHLLLGTAYLGSGMNSLAEQELNTALVLDSNLKQEASKRCYDIAKQLAKNDKSQANVALMKAKEYDLSLEKDEQFFFLANIDTEQSETARMESAKKYLTLFPSGANTAQATYELAEGLKSSGDDNQAKIYFKQLVSQFPATEWGKKASDQLASWTETKTVTVDARKSDWTDSGISIQKGDRITIYASGTVNHGGPSCGADGNSSLTPYGDAVVPSARYGALVGKIGTAEPIVVGSNYEVVAPRNGNLQFLVNDSGYNDNSGYFQLQVTLKKNVQ